MTIDILVVNYKTPGDLVHFLRSLEKHPPPFDWHLTIANVEPGPEDELVVAHYHDEATRPFSYLSFEENVGYATAVNRAATLGNAETIGIFNADTRFIGNVIEQCCKALIDNPEWAILGPKQVDDRGRITHGGIFGTLAQRNERGFHSRNSDRFSDVRDDATNVAGSAYFVKRKVWEELTSCPFYREAAPNAEGAFLPTPHYYEETFCSYHAITHGHRVVYYGKATMIHSWHKASPVGGAADRQLLPISKQMFRDACEKHGILHD